MARMAATTIYLDERQKKGLSRLAKVKGSHFSREVRTAIDQHLAGSHPTAGVSPEDLQRLAKEANASVERMLRRLDETSRRLDAVIRTVERSNRRALGWRK